MNEEDNFLAEIVANPHDDFPRLVYADWLEEHGDMRAEFLRVQCDIKKMLFGSDDYFTLHARRRELRQQIETGWLERLGYSGKPLELRSDNFDCIIREAQQPALVEFWAGWAAQCRMLDSVIDELAESFEGFALIGKIDVDANQELTIQLQIRSIPHILLFKQGEVVSQRIGVTTIDDLIIELIELLPCPFGKRSF